ncbi:MAG: ATP-binding protein, partial [Pirellulales bacterium]
RIIDSMSATATERSARITLYDLPPAWGDPTAIEQVFANLIGNALNYLDPERPGVIEIGSDQAVLESHEQADCETYYVRDNGLGIREEYQSKMFQAFKRLHPEVAKGEGMGLAIVRRVVERHSGKIWVESKVGVGSTFYVVLPSGTADRSLSRNSP